MRALLVVVATAVAGAVAAHAPRAELSLEERLSLVESALDLQGREDVRHRAGFALLGSDLRDEARIARDYRRSQAFALQLTKMRWFGAWEGHAAGERVGITLTEAGVAYALGAVEGSVSVPVSTAQGRIGIEAQGWSVWVEHVPGGAFSDGLGRMAMRGVAPDGTGFNTRLYRVQGERVAPIPPPRLERGAP